MVDIVIVNWNSGDFLSGCIASIIQFGDLYVDQVIVVDNNSTDDSLSEIDQKNNIQIIKNQENFGFAKGCNIGASYSNAENILFLNPDAMIYKDTIKLCCDYLNLPQSKDIGILGVKLYNHKKEVGRSCARFPTVKRLFFRSTGLEKLFPKYSLFMSNFDHLSIKEVDQVIGAFFLVRKSVFEKLRGFDERFFVYMEEVDFSYRAKLLGWKSVYYSDASAYHFGGGSSSKITTLRLFYSLRSRIQYCEKHLDKFSISLIYFFTFIIEPVTRLAFFLFKFKLHEVVATIKAYLILIKWVYSGIKNG